MRGQKRDVMLVARELLHPVGGPRKVRPGKGHMRQHGADRLLVAAIVGEPGGIAVIGPAMAGAGKKVGLVADLQRQEPVVHDVGHGAGFLHRVVQLVVAEIETPDQLPADRIHSNSFSSRRLASVTTVALGADTAVPWASRHAKNRGVSADADHALMPQIAHQLHIGVIAGRQQPRYRDRGNLKTQAHVICRNGCEHLARIDRHGDLADGLRARARKGQGRRPRHGGSARQDHVGPPQAVLPHR